MKYQSKLSKWIERNALKIVPILSILLLLEIFWEYPASLINWLCLGWAHFLQQKQEGSPYSAEHYYYVINTLIPVGMFLLTIVSVFFVRRSIVDNTRQRKLESVDKLIRDSVFELKRVLKSDVKLPYIIGEILDDDYSANHKWDINKVVTQVNAFINVSNSLPNKRLVQALKECLLTHHFHCDCFNASSVLKSEYRLLIDLILRRQKLERDDEFNEVTLKFCSYLFPVLQWVYSDTDDAKELTELEAKILQVSGIDEGDVREPIPSTLDVTDYDEKFKDYDHLSIEDILDYEKKDSTCQKDSTSEEDSTSKKDSSP